MPHPNVPRYWKEACRDLSVNDSVMGQLIREFPDVRLKSRGSAFETLLRAIVGQQISVKAARSIWERFAAQIGRISPENVAKQRLNDLRSCGLSQQKVSYIFDLAQHFTQGSINPRSFRGLEDSELIDLLCSVRGIGRWTAEMFLIFHLHRPNIWPIQDIGLIRAIERHYLGSSKASKSEIESAGDRFKPWRTVATWYLWRSLDPFPVEY
jgi:DNA-3-methyladenine glycosylase II